MSTAQTENSSGAEKFNASFGGGYAFAPLNIDLTGLESRVFVETKDANTFGSTVAPMLASASLKLLEEFPVPELDVAMPIQTIFTNLLASAVGETGSDTNLIMLSKHELNFEESGVEFESEFGVAIFDNGHCSFLIGDFFDRLYQLSPDHALALMALIQTVSNQTLFTVTPAELLHFCSNVNWFGSADEKEAAEYAFDSILMDDEGRTEADEWLESTVTKEEFHRHIPEWACDYNTLKSTGEPQCGSHSWRIWESLPVCDADPSWNERLQQVKRLGDSLLKLMSEEAEPQWSNAQFGAEHCSPAFLLYWKEQSLEFVTSIIDSQIHGHWESGTGVEAHFVYPMNNDTNVSDLVTQIRQFDKRAVAIYELLNVIGVPD